MLPRFPLRSVTCAAATAAVAVTALLTAGTATAAPSRYVALGDSYSSGTGTRRYLATGRRASGRSTPTRRWWPAAGATRSTCGPARAPPPRTSRSSARRADRRHGVRLDHRRRQRRGLRRRAHRVREAGLGQQLQRGGRRPQTSSTISCPARLTRCTPRSAPAPRRRGGRRRLPAIFNGEDCNALTWFSADRGDAPERHRGPAERQDLRGGDARPASPSPTRRPPSSGTPCATARSGSTACPARSSESYHPNRLGHSAGYAPARRHRLRGPPSR